MGAMESTVDRVQRGLTGLEIPDGTLRLNPRLPVAIRRLDFRIRFRGSWIGLECDHQRVRVAVEEGAGSAGESRRRPAKGENRGERSANLPARSALPECARTGA